MQRQQMDWTVLVGLETDLGQFGFEGQIGQYCAINK